MGRKTVRLSALLVLLATGTSVAAGTKRVDVGGYKLRVRIAGKGGPVVVFDAGLGDSSESWNWVAPEVARFTRTVTYDRAGLGRSQEGPSPRTSRVIIGELHSLLAGANVTGPYILVGHSFGALNMRLFASRYPDEVAALLLVDPTPVDFPARESELRTPEARLRTETLMSAASEAVREEMSGAVESAAQVRRAALPPGLLVVVLSSRRLDEGESFQRAWFSMQRELARRVGAIDHVVVDGSGHYIQYDDSELVIEAVRELVNLVRETATD
jgi:pimeloyl-ACP methyl ester carboxylesterase